MAIIQNHFYNIIFHQDNIIKILMKLEEYKNNIYPQSAKKIGEHIQGVEPLQSDNPYSTVLEETNHLMDLLHIEKNIKTCQRKVIDEQEALSFIKDIKKKVDDIQQVIQNIFNEKNENEQAIQLINHLKEEDISLDEIHELKYMTLRFGKLPLKQINKIEYFQNEHFIYKELSRDNEYLWIVYCSLNKDLGEIDNIFLAMDFKQIDIPDFAHGKMDDAINELYNEQQTMERYIEELKSRIEKLKNENEEKIVTYYSQLLYLKEIYGQCQYIVDLKDRVAIYAFSPFNKKEITEIFNDIDVSIVELPVNMYHEKGLDEPILLKNNSFVRPFEKLIKFKAGDHFDPTTLITIVMMLSAMIFLGDLGLGVALILLSSIIKGKNMEWIQRLGLAVLTGGLFTAMIFYQGPIYKLPFMLPDILSNSVMMKLVFFIVINLTVYILMMIIKNISRRKFVIKGGV